MKKYLLSLAIFLLSANLFATTYKIKQVNYELSPSSWKFLGTTKEYAITSNVPVDTNKVFSSKEEFDQYYEDFKTRLKNTRAFDSIEVNFTNQKDSEVKDQELITISVQTVDSVHMLPVPYFKFNSNDGGVFKLKIKDTNFLGTMNTMNTDLNFGIDTVSGENKYNLGFNFSYDMPFKAGIFDTTWVNDYTLSYTIGNDIPEWNAKTGLKFVLPTEKLNYTFEIYQSVINNLDYKVYDDALYFNNDFKFSVPIKVAQIGNLCAITYSPYIDFSLNWDFNEISKDNTDLSSPTLSFGHSLSGGRVNWKNNMRQGMNANITNVFAYNFQREILYPSLTTEVTAFTYVPLLEDKSFLNQIGFCADFYSYFLFVDFSNPYFKNDGVNIGSRMRGILDNQPFMTSEFAGSKSTQTPAALVWNFDMPIQIFSTDFEGKIFKYFNFDLQIAPFVDIALTYNKATKEWFNPKDGFYAAGIEVLVYPRKWSSFTVRGSLGFDIGRKFLADYLNMDWRKNSSKKEISIGVGLHY